MLKDRSHLFLSRPSRASNKKTHLHCETHSTCSIGSRKEGGVPWSNVSLNLTWCCMLETFPKIFNFDISSLIQVVLESNSPFNPKYRATSFWKPMAMRDPYVHAPARSPGRRMQKEDYSLVPRAGKFSWDGKGLLSFTSYLILIL